MSVKKRKLARGQARASRKEHIMDIDTGYEFYHCNLIKSTNSILGSYSEEVYTDTQAGREALLNHIMEEHRLGGVEIDVCDLDRVRDRILYEDPISANELMEYGIILERAIY
jgi:hypothetical protein